MAGLITNIITGMVHVKQQQELEAQKQAYEQFKNEREFFEKSILMPTIESGDMQTFEMQRPVAKKYYSPEQLKAAEARTHYMSEKNRTDRMLNTIRSITGALEGDAQPQARTPTQPQSAMPEQLSGPPPDELPPGASALQSMMPGQAQPTPTVQPAQTPTTQPAPAPRNTRRTITVNSEGKVSASFADVDPADNARNDLNLSVQNKIHEAFKAGQTPNIQDIIMSEQNARGTVLKPEEVNNIHQTAYGASFVAALNELERLNSSGKLKMTEPQMHQAAAQHAARVTGMRGIPQAVQQAVSPEAPRLPETTQAQLFAGTGQTPRTATPAGVAQAIDAQAAQATKQQYDNEAAQIQAQIANKPLDVGIAQKVEPLLSAERQTARIFDIFSRKPYLVGKGFTDMKAEMQKAMIQLEGAPKEERWSYQNGALLNSISSFIGKADPEAVELYRSIADLSDTILRARSGAQINEQEYRRLSGLLFSKWDEPATFKAGLDRVREELKESINNKIGLAVTPASEVLQRRIGGQPAIQPLQPGAAAPARPRTVPLQPLPNPLPTAPQTTAPSEPYEVRMTQDEVNKISQALRSAFKKDTKLYEADLAAFLVRRGFAKKGAEAQAKAKLLQEIWKGRK